MYGIGTVARLAQVSVRTLRYYDELGLLRPRWTDPDSGHRWYAPDQLPRLKRLLNGDATREKILQARAHGAVWANRGWTVGTLR